jgi:hydrogenase/urease accessory protein HupE
MKRFVAAFLILLSLLGTRQTHAHGMRTAYVEIVEYTPGQAILRFRTTIDTSAAPEFPAGCKATNVSTDALQTANSSTNPLVQNGTTFVLHCQGALAGREVGVTGLGTAISEAVVWVSQHDGATSSQILTAAQPRIRIPSSSSSFSRAQSNFAEYTPLGVKHIFAGADHLLFLLLLVLLLRRPKAILLAETAFTISHSLSFSGAALGWIHVSKEATEACIAMSLLLLALDVERKDRAAASANAVAAMALVFGLVHGLGFAGGMTELGMPSQNVGWALLGFGLGVEIGQVAFLAVAVVAAYFLQRSRFSFQGTMVLTYLAGGLAAYWFLDRFRDCLVVAGY